MEPTAKIPPGRGLVIRRVREPGDPELPNVDQITLASAIFVALHHELGVIMLGIAGDVQLKFLVDGSGFNRALDWEFLFRPPIATGDAVLCKGRSSVAGAHDPTELATGVVDQIKSRLAQLSQEAGSQAQNTGDAWFAVTRRLRPPA